MTVTASLAAVRAPLTAAQAAVRAVETRATRENVAALYEALGEFHGTGLDAQAFEITRAAREQVTRAEYADTWQALFVAEHSVSYWVECPEAEHAAEDAIAAVAALLALCTDTFDQGPTVEREAWHRAHLAGVQAVRTLCVAIEGHTDRAALDRVMVAFLDAVRRAIPYGALFEARRALVEYARVHRLFIVGMRQPRLHDGEWARRIGGAVYLFRSGAPYGSVTVQRVAGDGTVGPQRHFTLTERSRDVIAQVLHQL